MTESIWLVTKDDTGGAETVVNGVRAAVINKAAATSAAAVCAAAAVKLATLTGVTIPSNYFTSAVDVTDLSSGPLKDDGDCYLFNIDGVVLAKEEG